MTTESPAPSPAAAAAIAARMQIRNVLFMAINAKVVDLSDGKLSLSVRDVHGQWALVGRALRAVLPFEFAVDITRKDGKRSRSADFSIAVRLDYELAEDFAPADEDKLNDFVAVSGTMHAWPYVRAEFQSLTAKVGLPANTLPALVSGQVAQFVRVSRSREAEATMAESLEESDEGAAPADDTAA